MFHCFHSRRHARRSAFGARTCLPRLLLALSLGVLTACGQPEEPGHPTPPRPKVVVDGQVMDAHLVLSSRPRPPLRGEM